MDKFVVFVVLMVLSNHMVLYSNAHVVVHPRTFHLFLHPIQAANTRSELYVERSDAKAGKPQVLAQQAAAPQPVDPTNFKLEFVNSIFQIPIRTLTAVNELIQTITKNYATTGTLTGAPAKSSVVLVDSTPHSSSPVAQKGNQASASSPNSLRPDTGARPVAAASAPVAVTTTSTSTSTTTTSSSSSSSAAPSASPSKGVTPSPQTAGVTL